MKISPTVVSVRKTGIGGEKPCICVPVVGKDADEILSQTKDICRKKPDLIEWRADFFKEVRDQEKVFDVARSMRRIAGEIPILFTIRSEKEGGEPVFMTNSEKVSLLEGICQSQWVDLIDYELRDEENISVIRDISRQYGIRMILSFHHFHSTPSKEVLIEKMRKAEALGADMAKAAVMPSTMQDVLLLLEATEEARSQVRIPLITMSMGRLGAITRLAGWMFGSAVTFAVGNQSSAPGQMPVEDVKHILPLIQKYTGC